MLNSQANEAILTPLGAPRILRSPVRNAILCLQANKCDLVIGLPSEIECWALHKGVQDSTVVKSPAGIVCRHTNRDWTILELSGDCHGISLDESLIGSLGCNKLFRLISLASLLLTHVRVVPGRR